ncbi:hypothetical protein AOA12_14855 [Microbacterium sp. No. 7]|nr:hypothetical protein AOA12_14855 [Microbacterium sp. No. 7]
MTQHGGKAPHLVELGSFLRSRRGSLTLEIARVTPRMQQRRVSGLRREEVARLANISVDYYIRIEQGRLLPTASVIEDIGSALSLEPDEVAYLKSLANYARNPSPPTPEPSCADEAEYPNAYLRNVLDQLTNTPALILGPRTDILAWNAMASALWLDLDRLLPRERNYIRLAFLGPGRRLFTDEDWEETARSCVAYLRRTAAVNPGDPLLAALVDELMDADERFAQLWDSRVVDRQDSGRKTVLHPKVGRMELEWNFFRYTGAPEQRLLLYSAVRGSESAWRLSQLLD